MDKQNDQHREQFERDYRAFKLAENELPDFSLAEDGTYIDPKIQDAWKFKQAINAWWPLLPKAVPEGKGEGGNQRGQGEGGHQQADGEGAPLKDESESLCPISAQRGEGGATLYNYYCPTCQSYLGETYDKGSVPTKSDGRNMCEKCTGSAQGEGMPSAKQTPPVPEGYALVPIDRLKAVHRDLDACQKVIWLAGVGDRGHGFDPSYCEDAQERLKEIEGWIAPERP